MATRDKNTEHHCPTCGSHPVTITLTEEYIRGVSDCIRALQEKTVHSYIFADGTKLSKEALSSIRRMDIATLIGVICGDGDNR